jgi:pyridoxine 4-dehydrogenase
MLMRFAHGPETIRIGDRTVRRLGFGAMRLPGKDGFGEPSDPATAHAVLRRAIELGINFIDTAWYYGPMVSNRLIAEALHPYPFDLVIATKVGSRRGSDRSWQPALRPEEIRVALEDDLRSLRLETLPVVHLRWTEGSEVSFATALDTLIAAKNDGMIQHIALSNVTVGQLEEALAKTPIVAVQNMFAVGGNDAAAEAVLVACEQRQIPFIPFSPPSVAAGVGAHEVIAKRLGSTPAQLAIAWYLARSRTMLPIPGTGKINHLEENVGAVHLALDAATVAVIAR